MAKKTKPKSEKIAYKFSEVDKKIINILMDNGRATLKSISKQVHISIDAVKDHIVKMKKAGAIDKFTIHVDPSFFNLPLQAHVYIKFKNVTEKSVNEFINYLKKYTRIITLISILGDYDLFLVITGKDTEDLENQKIKIREKFQDIIGNWNETVTSKIHKLEYYRF